MDDIKHYLMDMDGVLVQGSMLLPGAAAFVQQLRAQGIPFLILTNNSKYTPRDLQVRLSYLGLHVPPEAIFTSALAGGALLTVAFSAVADRLGRRRSLAVTSGLMVVSAWME